MMLQIFSKKTNTSMKDYKPFVRRKGTFTKKATKVSSTTPGANNASKPSEVNRRRS